MATLNVTVAQFAATLDVERNLSVIAEQARLAAEQGADLVVFPENSMFTDKEKDSGNPHHSEPLDGTFVDALSGIARDNKISMVVGISESSGDAKHLNTLVHIDQEGNLANQYRKIHLYDAFGYRESDKVQPADIHEPTVFEINGIKVGMLICYDLRFPEAFRWNVDSGADVILLPAAWAVGPMKELHWEVLVRARAIENTVYMVACGQTAGSDCTGQSMIVDPMGTICASAGERPGLSPIVTVDSARIDAVRQTNPSLKNRRFQVIPK